MTSPLRSLAPVPLLLAAACGQPVAKPQPAETAPSPSASSTSAIRPCTANIRVIAAQADAAAGHRFLTIAYNNIEAKTSCTMTGYPKVYLVKDLGIAGRERVVGQARPTLRGQSGLPAGVEVPPTVTLGPGTSAIAIVEARAVAPGTGMTCPEFALATTPPGFSEHPSDAVPASVADETFPSCDLQVHPVMVGDLTTSPLPR